MNHAVGAAAAAAEAGAEGTVLELTPALESLQKCKWDLVLVSRRVEDQRDLVFEPALHFPLL